MALIEKTHDIIFNWLHDWSKRAKQEKVLNPYFYVRTKEDDRFKKGYWFPGNDQYMCVSFWAGGDTKNRTPNIYLEINGKYGISIKLIARDSANKELYFGLLAKHLGGFHRGNVKGVFTKVLSRDTKDYLAYLYEFVENEKVLIDTFLKNTLDNTDSKDYLLLHDEYSSPTGFISQGQFDTLTSNVLRQKEKLAPKDVKVNIIAENKTGYSLPDGLIFIKKFEFANYKGIIRCSIPEIQHFSNWIFITGENGFGKTCILQALTLGLTNYPENPKYYTSEDNSIEKVVPDISVKFKFKTDDPDPTNFLSIVNQSNFRTLNDFFIAYGVNRLEPQREQSENVSVSNSSNIFTLFEGGGLLKNFNYELKKYFYSAKDRFKVLKQLIVDVTNERITDIEIDNYDLKYIEKTSDGKLPGVGFENLATGYRNIINIVGDIYVRFTESQKTIDPKKLTGIVCIDELENHLHVKYQKELPSLLTKIFPNIQFIATTHSPIPLIGAIDKATLIRVDRTAEEGITTEIVKIDNAVYLNPNIILTSPIFGLKEIFSDGVKDFQKLRTEDTWEEMQDNDALDAKLLKIYNDRKSKLEE